MPARQQERNKVNYRISAPIEIVLHPWPAPLSTQAILLVHGPDREGRIVAAFSPGGSSATAAASCRQSGLRMWNRRVLPFASSSTPRSSSHGPRSSLLVPVTPVSFFGFIEEAGCRSGRLVC